MRRYMKTTKKVNKELVRETFSGSGSGGRCDEPILDDYDAEEVDLDYESYNLLEDLQYDDCTLFFKSSMVEIVEAIRFIESGSLDPMDIFQNMPKHFRFNSFQLLLMNTLTWGSYYPFQALLGNSVDIQSPVFNIDMTIVSSLRSTELI